jgi:hypothetical protein
MQVIQQEGDTAMDEDSEKEIDKMTEAPKGTGHEVEFWGDFRMGDYILMQWNMI